MRTFLALVVISLSYPCFAAGTAATLYSEGQKQNAANNTVLAQTGALTSGGLLGANYEVTVLVNGSSAMTYRLEVLNAQNNIVSTIYLSAPANQATIVDPRASFFIPNGYKLQVRSDSGVILGATHQASLIVKLEELIDK